MEQRLIKTEVLIQIIKYLASKPYGEVASIISLLQECPVHQEKDDA